MLILFFRGFICVWYLFVGIAERGAGWYEWIGFDE